MKINLFFFLIFFNSYGQIYNGRIIYGVNIEMIEGYKGTILEKPYNETIENAKYLNFKLIFTTENAVFSFDEGLLVGNSDLFMSKVSAGYMNEVYQNKEFSLTPVYKMYGEYLLKTESVKDWVLVNETKEIEGFVCYKATSTKIVINSKGTFHFPIIAWYCPKIPISYGPNGYGNLPGLILELQVRNVVYGAKTIDLNLKKSPVLKKVDNYPIITQEEFSEMVKKGSPSDTYKGMFKKPDDKF